MIKIVEKFSARKFLITFLTVLGIAYLILYFMDIRWVCFSESDQELSLIDAKILKEEGYIREKDWKKYMEKSKKSMDEARQTSDYSKSSSLEKNAIFLTKMLRNNGQTVLSENQQRSRILEKLKKYGAE